jgi:hypothetical protein
MTKSPPTTGTPPYVRSYGTYCVDPDEITVPCTNFSFELAFRYAGRVATSSAAFWAARACAVPGEAGGVGAAVAVADVAPTAIIGPTMSVTPTARQRRDKFTVSPLGRAVTVVTDAHVYLRRGNVVNSRVNY